MAIPPKTTSSSNTDLLTIIQNGIEKSITKSDFLSLISNSLNVLSTDLNSTRNQVSSNTLPRNVQAINTSLSVREPSSNSHAATKNYVDKAVSSSVRDLSSTRISNVLRYSDNNSRNFGDKSLVDKEYVDTQIISTLKTILGLEGSMYPAALAGDTFLVENFSEAFGENGPEVQAGDILICTANTEGGTHLEAGDQFAIVNTNVVISTEELAGILRVATDAELETLDTNSSAITPFKYKRVLESSSEYNRISVEIPTVSLSENDKGIIGVDCRKNAVTINLPTISRLSHPTITKFIIKDEYGKSSKNNITIVATGGDTVQGSRTYKITENYSAITIYSDSEGQWFIENSFTAATESSSKVQSFFTDNSSNGETATATGAYEPVMSLDVDLSEYPVGTSFKTIIYYNTLANAQDKKVAVGINGSQIAVTESSLLDANPSAKSGIIELTLMNLGTVNTAGICNQTQGALSSTALTNQLNIDWNTKVVISADVLCATAVADLEVFGLQIVPLK